MGRLCFHDVSWNQLSFLGRDWIRNTDARAAAHDSGASSMVSRVPGVPGLEGLGKEAGLIPGNQAPTNRPRQEDCSVEPT